MNIMESRRRMLLRALNKIFIIYRSRFYAGEVLEHKTGYVYVEGKIPTIGGRKTTQTGITIYVPVSECSQAQFEARINSQLGDQYDDYVLDPTQIGPDEYGIECYYAHYTGYNYYDGYVTIGSYDFTKYKTLHFTVSSNTSDLNAADPKWTPSVVFGDYSTSITSTGEYSIDIKGCMGQYDITFNSPYWGNKNYSVDNIYLKG